MRIAHVVSSLQIGGAERLVVDLASAQQRDGFEVTIVDLGRDACPLGATARALGLRVIDVGRVPSRVGRSVVLAALFAGRGGAMHIHNPGALRAVLPVLPAVRGRVIYTRHGASTSYRSTAWRAVHRVARRFVDRVTFVTDEARTAYESVNGTSPLRHLVIPNGVVVASAPPLRAVRDRLRIGMVGRLVELKGQHVVLDAIAALPPSARRRVEVHLFGDGPERERLTDQARDALPDVPVEFHGTVLDREHIYRVIDVLAVGSRTEGHSLAIMEAMARGVPVIATAVGGNVGLVHEGETGMLVPPGDAAAITRAVAALLADPALVTRLGRASHYLIATQHSIDAVTARYHVLYAGR